MSRYFTLCRLLRLEIVCRSSVVAGERLVGGIGDAFLSAIRSKMPSSDRLRGGWRRGSRAVCRAGQFRSIERLGPFDGHGIAVDAVNAAAYGIAQRMAVIGREATPPVRRRATRVAIRRAAASRNCPDPQAGSITVTPSNAAGASCASLSTRSSARSRALSSRA